jgi:uncharacterized protein
MRRSPWPVVRGLWAAAIVLSLYGTADIQRWVRGSAFWSERGSALAAADALVRAGEATRLPALRRALEADREAHAVARVEQQPIAVPDTPAPRRTVTRLLLVGASTIQFHLGIELERRLASSYEGLTVDRVGKMSTGLARPDVFDWPAKLRALVAEHKPDAIVANFGGNDGQGMVLDDGRPARFGSAEWDAAYLARVRRMVDIGRAADARVVMLGMSTTRDPSLSRRMAHVNALTERAAVAAGAAYLSIWDLGAGPRGEFQDVFTIDGLAVRTRLADGKHFSRAGALMVMDQLVARLERLLDLPAHQPAELPSDRHGNVTEVLRPDLRR